MNLENKLYKIGFTQNGVNSLVLPDDEHRMDLILQNDNDYINNYGKFFREMGTVIIRYEIDNHQHSLDTNDQSLMKNQVQNDDSIHLSFSSKNMKVCQSFQLTDKEIKWGIEIANINDRAITIGDLELPLFFNTAYQKNWRETYLQRVVKHSFIAGAGSFILLMKANADPPFLLITTDDATIIECFDSTQDKEQGYFAGRSEGRYSIFLQAGFKTKNIGKENWRIPTSKKLVEPGEKIKYGFSMNRASSYQDARDILFRKGLNDIRIAPGMTVPVNLPCKIAIRSKSNNFSIIPEFPESTIITQEEKNSQHRIYSVFFKRLGENIIIIENDYGEKTHLQFFITQSLKTLIKKRAAFIVNNQICTDKTKWYNGLFGLWNMDTKTSPNPDNLQGLRPYMVSGGDDCFKTPYLVRKNFIYPVDNEIEAIEYYLENYVWGKHQRTDIETPYPFGIYGCDNWKQNRYSDVGFNSGGNGQEHMWRTFDYPHLIITYFFMYRIARRYPEKCKYLSAEQYLERAFGTAKAFFTVPINIKMGEPYYIKGFSDWAYKQGNYNEKVIPDLIDALINEGKEEKGEWLKGEWEKKVKYFIYDHEYPFGSEMFFDSTAFESTHAIAKYALSNILEPDKNLWKDPNSQKWYSHSEINQSDFISFMDLQIKGNIACRGWLENSFYQLGSDIRSFGESHYNLSYMSQMGGWSILDYGLNYSKNNSDYINIGYASILSSWALLNSGTRETDFGYWYPGKENDGAAGWAYEPKIDNKAWDLFQMKRGIWPVDGEIDIGFGGALDGLCTILVDDPVFGILCYGGELKKGNQEYIIQPLDGVEKKLFIRLGERELDIEMNRDQFSDMVPVCISNTLDYIIFGMSNLSNDDHITIVSLRGPEISDYHLFLNQKLVEQTKNKEKVVFFLPLQRNIDTIIELKRINA